MCVPELKRPGINQHGFGCEEWNPHTGVSTWEHAGRSLSPTTPEAELASGEVGPGAPLFPAASSPPATIVGAPQTLGFDYAVVWADGNHV